MFVKLFNGAYSIFQKHISFVSLCNYSIEEKLNLLKFLSPVQVKYALAALDIYSSFGKV